MAQAQSSLKTLERAAKELAAALNLPVPHGQLEREALCRAAQRALDSPDVQGVRLSSGQWQTQEADLRTLLNAGLTLSGIHAEYDHVLTPGAWDQDLSNVKQTLTAKGGRWWRGLSSEYRRANKQLGSLLRPPRPSAIESRTSISDAVLEAQRQQGLITQHQSLAQDLLGSRWHGEQSDWDYLSRLFEWVWGINQEIATGMLPAGIIDFLAEGAAVANLAELIKAVDDAAQSHSGDASVIRSGLETARRDLLDLGLRSNPLLNYRLLRARGLEVVDELPAQVHHVLVNQGRAMSFLPVSEEEPDWLLGQPKEVVAADRTATRHIDTKLQTGLSSQELQARLLSTFYLANSFIQEQGVNTLFLALGMLNWYETADTLEGKWAPVILVPVTLERSNVRERFQLKHTGEDPGENLSMMEKARSEFGVTLPGFPDAEDLNIEGYFDLLTEAVQHLPRWSIDRNSVALGFFSFSKFLMYRDLNIDIWPDGAEPTEHPIIGALMHEGFDEPAPTINSDDHLDQHLTPSQIHHVVDADGSQTLALVDVNDGRNLVVQGPPGTGKSQTITNMIAEAIGRGRTALFVSEKMAALEVVKRRLDNVGLGDACLELHSHKTTKKTMLAELQRTLELGQPRLGQIETDLDTLAQLRDRLNAYCEAVNNPIEDSGVNPYRAYGELALLQQRTRGIDLPKLDIPAMKSWSEADFRRKEDIVQELQVRVAGIGLLQTHPFWGVGHRVLLPVGHQKICESLPLARESLTKSAAAGVDLASTMGVPGPLNRADSQGLCLAAQKAMEAPELDGVVLRSEEWRTNREELDSLINSGLEIAGLHESYDPVLSPGAWAQDLAETRQILDTKGRKRWRLISGEYRQARARLAGLCRKSLPGGVNAKIQLIDAVLKAQSLQSTVDQHDSLGQRLFGSRWQGEVSDWEALSSLTKWLLHLFDNIETRVIPKGIITFLEGDPSAVHLGPYVEAVSDADLEHRRDAGKVVEDLELDVVKRFGSGPGLEDQSFDVQLEVLDTWRDQIDDIHDIVSFNNISDTCRGEGVEPVLAIAESWPQASNHLLDVFQQAWFESVLSQVLAQRPELAAFDGSSHQQIVERFRDMDVLALQHNQARLAHAHWERLPRQEGGGQLGILRREFQKRGRHLPIRQLVELAGNAVQAIKPVLMMSPLSIATYIPPGSLKFDLVIFDEASQVKPVDALGAIMRAGQAVVVGDDQQLPPTSFFDVATQGTEEDEESATSDIPSVLGLFASKNAPSRMLRWHYRSRHESLIAVSNQEFYDNRLVVFPSPDAERGELGLRLHHLPDTVYDRGRSRANALEAETVARAVMEHAKASPDLTLGVAAFSAAQMTAVLDRLELLRREDPSCESFFAAHPHEPFFVKNLESVQGDERDVIFISVGYGRNATGQVDMNFGPLNNDGGQRRLNVLITRAKRRCEVFTNLTAEDIDLERTKAAGPRALKTFLKFAREGELGLSSESRSQAETPLEDVIAAQLTAMGYIVRHQIGSAGYAIDLAIVDPGQPGRYLLGIECDGASYNSPRWARDRDRLRQQVLEGLGWRIHRIWSTDWSRNPQREIQSLAQAIESAKSKSTVKQPEKSPVHTVQREQPFTTPGVEANAIEYTLAIPKIATKEQEFLTAPDSNVALWVASVVELESPVHLSEVSRRIADAAESRRGRRFQEVIDRAIGHAVESGRVRRDAEFLWRTDMEQPVLRDRSKLPLSSRKIELVAPEEIALAVERVAAVAYGISRKDIVGGAVRLLGFGRVTSGMRARIEPIIRQMLADGALIQHGDQLMVSGQVQSSSAL